MTPTKGILVTGGSGFIGSAFVLDWLARAGTGEPLLNLDKLTYAADPQTLAAAQVSPRYTFVHGDVCDRTLLRDLLASFRPRAVLHFAAESHVDRSIVGPEAFLRTNIEGTFTLLEATRTYFNHLPLAEQSAFRVVHVSTDEVFGSLDDDDPAFTEETPYAPRSPYAASKAAGDHLARAWHHTYGLPSIVTNCSNNYGPRQFPEKLIPLMLTSALRGKPIPLYGDGLQVRDWLFVGDHVRALRMVLDRGRPGETYNIGGGNQRTNLQVALALCELLDELVPESPYRPHRQLITFVADRPGHDRRYAMNSSRMERDLGWCPVESFESGLRLTVEWYIEHAAWTDRVLSGAYRDWERTHYAGRGPAASVTRSPESES